VGQYHKLYNLDKKQYVHAHRIDNGLKLMEQCGFEKSTASALWLLLAASNGRGGGDARPHPLIGTWAGDRIAVIGDYAKTDDVPGFDAAEIRTSEDFTDISAQVKQMLDAEFKE
jgi:hypothetical protein